MIKNELAQGVFQYSFSPLREGSALADTIIAVFDGSKALLIDTGYESEAKQLADEFSANGITVEKIVISHWHSDHFYGLDEFLEVPVYGSANYAETHLSEGFTKEQIDSFPGFNKISEPVTIEFGKHKLELIPHIGHSVCTLLIKINDEFLFISDEIFLTTDGKLMVPWLCGKGNRNELIDKQLSGWGKLKEYSNYTIIPAHGPAFDGSKLAEYLDNLTAYLCAIKDTDGKISYDDAVKNCSNPPANQSSVHGGSWHNSNCEGR